MGFPYRASLGALALVLLSVWGSGGASDKEHAHADSVSEFCSRADPRASTEDFNARVAARYFCVGAEDGTVCGDQKHCLAGECQLNVCGDGLPRYEEECDDGNDDPHDGCDEHCRQVAL